MPTPYLYTRLASLAQSAWDQHQQMLANSLPILQNSCPVLYFGDSKEYERSGIRIITAALNPSEAEFLDGNNTSASIALRFPHAMPFNMSTYLGTLDRYFSHNPYVKWFGNFEPILNGLMASYYSNKPPKNPVSYFPNRVLHTDILTASATSKGWGNLAPQDQQAIMNTAIQQWPNLVSEIMPDLIILAAGRTWRSHLVSSWPPFQQQPTCLSGFNNVSLGGYACPSSGQIIPMVVIPNNQGQPGYGMNDQQKHHLGECIRKSLFPMQRDYP